MFLTSNKKLQGMIAVSDSPKSSAKEAIAQLHNMGVEKIGRAHV